MAGLAKGSADSSHYTCAPRLLRRSVVIPATSGKTCWTRASSLSDPRDSRPRHLPGVTPDLVCVVHAPRHFGSAHTVGASRHLRSVREHISDRGWPCIAALSRRATSGGHRCLALCRVHAMGVSEESLPARSLAARDRTLCNQLSMPIARPNV